MKSRTTTIAAKMHSAVTGGLLDSLGVGDVGAATLFAAHPPAVDQGGQVEQQDHSTDLPAGS